MLVDVAVSRLPLYAKHFYMPFLYTLVYSIFNGVYVGAGGKDSVRTYGCACGFANRIYMWWCSAAYVPIILNRPHPPFHPSS